jgi:RNA polymerase sigma-70 factor (ECF subfamily)
VSISPDQEQVWVLQAKKGNQEAFATLVQAYQRPVYNLAYRMLGSAESAEDAAQETFLRAYTRLESYDPAFKFASWILSIASHHCIDRLRHNKGAQVSLDDENAGRWIPDPRLRPEERALRNEQRRDVREQLAQLPPQYRLVVVLRYWHDLSYDEIARMTESTESAVKSRLHRARQMMAELLASDQPGAEGAAADASGGHPANRRRLTHNAVSRCI